jgi:uncharacterized protein
LTKPAATSPELPARIVPGGIMLHLKVTPKASHDVVESVEVRPDGAVLAVKVRALPDKGEANNAVVATVAKWLSEPKTKLRVAAGAKARLKQVFVAGEPAELMEKLAARLARKEGRHG